MQVCLLLLRKKLQLLLYLVVFSLEYMGICFVQKIVAVIKRILLFLIIVVGVIASAYFGYKGLMWLNDYMNKYDSQQKRRYNLRDFH